MTLEVQDFHESKKYTEQLLKNLDSKAINFKECTKAFNSIAWPVNKIPPSFRLPLTEKNLQNPNVRNSVKGYIKSVQNKLPELHNDLARFISGLSRYQKMYPAISTYIASFKNERGFLSKYRKMEKLKSTIKNLIVVQGLSSIAEQEVQRCMALLEAEAVKVNLVSDIGTQLLLCCLTGGASAGLEALKNAPKGVKLAVLLRHQQIYAKFITLMQGKQVLLGQILHAVKILDWGTTGLQIVSRMMPASRV